MSKRVNGRPLPDFDLWVEVAKTILPLKGTQVPKRKSLLQLGDGALPLPAPAQPSPPQPRPKKPVSFTFPSYQSDGAPGRQPAGTIIEPRLRRRLGRGQIEIDATLDLHGMRQAEAHAALTRFVTARVARGDRTILVITGKGIKKLNGDAATLVERGVLRSMLPLWLKSPELAPLIAGWDVSAAGHGGDGAYYVRLKRQGRAP